MSKKWTVDSVLKLSDLYYNFGLEKAQAKDFTAATENLKKCIRLNGSHINARNLLGLVYYQTGEFVEALTQWVVSDSLLKEGNLAQYFLEQVQYNGAELHNIEMALGYYNRAASLVEDGSDDLAIMQLRKVVDLYPSFLKAYQLLALLYIRRRSYSRAERVLRRALRYDEFNPDTTRYLTELRVINIRRQRKGTDEEQWNWEEEAFSHLSGNDVIKPKGISNIRVNWGSAAFFALGVIVALIVCMKGILPAKVSSLNQQINELTVSTTSDINNWRTMAEQLQQQIESLNGQVDTLQGNVGDTQTMSGELAAYSNLTSALYDLTNNNNAEACLHYVAIDSTQVPESETSFWDAYNSLTTQVGSGALSTVLSTGQNLYESSDYDAAKTYLNAVLTADSTNVSAMYYLALTYQASGDTEQANTLFTQITTDYPDSAEAEAIAAANESAGTE